MLDHWKLITSLRIPWKIFCFLVSSLKSSRLLDLYLEEFYAAVETEGCVKEG